MAPVEDVMRAKRLLLSQAAALSLPDPVIEACLENLKKLRDMGLSKGRDLERLVPAVIYASCKQHLYPLSLREIPCRKKGFFKTLRSVYEALGYYDGAGLKTTAESFLRRLAAKLELSVYTDEALALLNRFGEYSTIAAAAALTIVASRDITMSAIARESGFSIAALSNKAKTIRKKLEIEQQISNKSMKNEDFT
jgi:transcription initiation factor TFIIIB Brf1 subunit/transcription initiation factor TFIIB